MLPVPVVGGPCFVIGKDVGGIAAACCDGGWAGEAANESSVATAPTGVDDGARRWLIYECFIANFESDQLGATAAVQRNCCDSSLSISSCGCYSRDGRCGSLQVA